MATQESIIINLSPGDIYFGESPKVINTLLGSCVAMTVWHEGLKLGGMCHYLIAEQSSKSQTDNYRYGEHSLKYLNQKMASFAELDEFEIQLFGGSNMYNKKIESTIGEQNVSFALQWLKKHKLNLSYNDTLGESSRKLIFDLSTGKIQVTHHQL
jgi:chemotaxis protein CheD